MTFPKGGSDRPPNCGMCGSVPTIHRIHHDAIPRVAPSPRPASVVAAPPAGGGFDRPGGGGGHPRPGLTSRPPFVVSLHARCIQTNLAPPTPSLPALFFFL